MSAAMHNRVKILPTVMAIVDTRPDHLRELSHSIRQEDERELLAFGLLPQQALWRSYKASVYTKTALVDGKVAAIWGCAGTFMSDDGEPWLITSKEIERLSPLRVARDYQREVIKMLNMFQRLVNYVDSRYTSAIRLLDIAGFHIGELESLGKHDVMFRKFTMTRN